MYFTVKRVFHFGTTKFRQGETYLVNPLKGTPTPDDPAAKHCAFGETEAEAQEAYHCWVQGGCRG